MPDADALYKNAGAFAMFEKLKPRKSVYFNRTAWPNGELSWLGPWENQLKAQDIAEFLKIRRVNTAFTVRVSKKI